MSDTSARLGLPYLAAGQMQKHVTLNEALTRLDALVQCRVVSCTVTSPPGSPDDGALYILPEDAEGEVWAGYAAGSLLRAEGGGWIAVPVAEGQIVVIGDTGEVLIRHETAWRPLSTFLAEFQNLQRLGIGATADEANPFLARLNSALWTAREVGDGGTGDLRVVMNKSGPSSVLSLILQTAWSGRAEIGLIGEDALGVKVSGDGSDWTEALKVDPASGRVSFARGATRREVFVIEEDGDWTPPAWARWVEATVLGAGGGGAGGAFGASGTVRTGGGGGASGSLSRAVWPTEVLTSDLMLEVGTGGAGGGSGTDGLAGGQSRILLGGTPLLLAEGGGGGTATGVAGLSGAGEINGNAGGQGGTTYSAEPGATTQGEAPGGGGGGGGGLSASDALSDAGEGAVGGRVARVADGGIAGSASAGTSGDNAAPDFGPPGGGGGGGSASLSTGHAGGDGGLWGGGGGGGGAGVTAGGSGGSGADGLILLVAVG